VTLSSVTSGIRRDRTIPEAAGYRNVLLSSRASWPPHVAETRTRSRAETQGGLQKIRRGPSYASAVRVNLSPMHRTEHVLEHVPADLPSQARTRVLVEPEVNSAIDAGIVDVISYLFP
jgi:hypothetical protein